MCKIIALIAALAAVLAPASCYAIVFPIFPDTDALIQGCSEFVVAKCVSPSRTFDVYYDEAGKAVKVYYLGAMKADVDVLMTLRAGGSRAPCRFTRCAT